MVSPPFGATLRTAIAPYGLVESKNGSVVRKQLGYSHIPGRHASLVNDFTLNILSPYLDFHRPCCFPEEVGNDKGRITKRYRYELMMTPYEKLKSVRWIRLLGNPPDR